MIMESKNGVKDNYTQYIREMMIDVSTTQVRTLTKRGRHFSDQLLSLSSQFNKLMFVRGFY